MVKIYQNRIGLSSAQSKKIFEPFEMAQNRANPLPFGRFHSFFREMNLLGDAMTASAFAAFGVFLGYWFSRLPKSCWMPAILFLGVDFDRADVGCYQIHFHG